MKNQTAHRTRDAESQFANDSNYSDIASELAAYGNVLTLPLPLPVLFAAVPKISPV